MLASAWRSAKVICSSVNLVLFTGGSSRLPESLGWTRQAATDVCPGGPGIGDQGPDGKQAEERQPSPRGRPLAPHSDVLCSVARHASGAASSFPGKETHLEEDRHELPAPHRAYFREVPAGEA